MPYLCISIFRTLYTEAAVYSVCDKKGIILHTVLWIRIRSAPKLFAGFGSGEKPKTLRIRAARIRSEIKKTFLIKFTISQQNSQFKKTFKKSLKRFKIQTL